MRKSSDVSRTDPINIGEPLGLKGRRIPRSRESCHQAFSECCTLFAVRLPAVPPGTHLLSGEGVSVLGRLLTCCPSGCSLRCVLLVYPRLYWVFPCRVLHTTFSLP